MVLRLLAAAAAIATAAAAGAELDLPPGQLGHLLESLVEPRKPWFHGGLLGSLQICSGEPRPPLWIARRDGRTVYLVAAASLPATALEPAYVPVKQALGCADVAYFELPCAADPAGPVGKYLSHCLKYPTNTPLDSVKARLPQKELEKLRGAVLALAGKARWSCGPAVDRLKAAAAALNETTSRTTLLSLYQGILAALSPSGCDPSGLDYGRTHSQWLREEFGTKRPTFGLEDVSVQCNLYEGDTVEQDTRLARFLAAELSSPDWFKSKMDRHKLVADAMRCGNLQQLAADGGALAKLGWLRERLLAQRNPGLAKGIEQALVENPGKSIAAVMGLAHFMSMNGTSSVLDLLRQTGFAIEQAHNGIDLGCSSAAPLPPQPERPGRCLEPSARAQPASCMAFEVAFKKAVQKDAMYGRSKSSTGCKACADSNSSCSCAVQWKNTTGFEELCTSFSVDGVQGQVLAMDLVRNPGSVHPGSAHAEKTVLGLYENCYATTCSVPMLEEMALRSWYSKDPTVSQGLVSLRKPEDRSIFAGGVLNTGSFWTWPWYVWPLGLLASALAIWCLISCFRCRAPRKRSRGAHLPPPPTHKSGRSTRGAKLPPHAAATGAWGGQHAMVPPALAHAAGQQQPGYPTLLPHWGSMPEGQEMPLLPMVKPGAVGAAGPAVALGPGFGGLGGPWAGGVAGGAGGGSLYAGGSFYGAGGGQNPAYEPLQAQQGFAQEGAGLAYDWRGQQASAQQAYEPVPAAALSPQGPAAQQAPSLPPFGQTSMAAPLLGPAAAAADLAGAAVPQGAGGPRQLPAGRVTRAAAPAAAAVAAAASLAAGLATEPVAAPAAAAGAEASAGHSAASPRAAVAAPAAAPVTPPRAAPVGGATPPLPPPRMAQVIAGGVPAAVPAAVAAAAPTFAAAATVAPAAVAAAPAARLPAAVPAASAAAGGGGGGDRRLVKVVS